MVELVRTARLVLRGWSVDDADQALQVYGHSGATEWVSHELHRVHDLETMRAVLRDWISEQQTMTPGTGRWAMTLIDSGAVIGGISLLPMPVPEADVEMSYRLAPRYWGHGYTTEAARALAGWGFERSLVEVFALVPPDNERAAATARRIGMEWVGESDKYHGRYLEVYRLRPDDLAHADHDLLPHQHPHNIR